MVGSVAAAGGGAALATPPVGAFGTVARERGATEAEAIATPRDAARGMRGGRTAVRARGAVACGGGTGGWVVSGSGGTGRRQSVTVDWFIKCKAVHETRVSLRLGAGRTRTGVRGRSTARRVDDTSPETSSRSLGRWHRRRSLARFASGRFDGHGGRIVARDGGASRVGWPGHGCTRVVPGLQSASR